MTAEPTPCDFCIAAGDPEPSPALDDAWIKAGPDVPFFHACRHHWRLVRELGVIFDNDGTPTIGYHGTPLRFLPLIEQMYAREWLLEKALTAYREYVTLLEGPVAEPAVEHALDRIRDAEQELEKGPVRV